MEKGKRTPEPEYIKKMMDRANVKNIIGYLIYGTEIYPEDGDYEERIENTYKKLEQITNSELGFKAGIMFMADIYTGRDRFGK